MVVGVLSALRSTQNGCDAFCMDALNGPSPLAWATITFRCGPQIPTERRVGQAIGVGEAMLSSFIRLSGFRLFWTDSLLGFRPRSKWMQKCSAVRKN
jgi:hypothetical protein